MQRICKNAVICVLGNISTNVFCFWVFVIRVTLLSCFFREVYSPLTCLLLTWATSVEKSSPAPLRQSCFGRSPVFEPLPSRLRPNSPPPALISVEVPGGLAGPCGRTGSTVCKQQGSPDVVCFLATIRQGPPPLPSPLDSLCFWLSVCSTLTMQRCIAALLC